MEQNKPVIEKKVWRLVRVMYFMLRKGISKRIFMLDLNMIIKRGKIAGKALQNLMFHRHHATTSTTTHCSHSHLSFPSPPPGEYEFSCSNSPAYPPSLSSFHRKHHGNYNHAPPTEADYDIVTVNAALTKAFEMLNSETASPALPGFGRSPMVRQLRITDSPFPLHDVGEDNHVDEAAEKFIMKFYNDLRRQNTMSSEFQSLSRR